MFDQLLAKDEDHLRDTFNPKENSRLMVELNNFFSTITAHLNFDILYSTLRMMTKAVGSRKWHGEHFQ